METFKGFIIFYINASIVGEGSPCQGQSIHDFFTAVQQHNQTFVENLKKQGYFCMFVPVYQESSRIEKVDIEMPHPRYVLPHVDIVMNDKIYDDIANKVSKETNE